MDRSIALDRAVAWCSRTWDIESAALADTVLERLRMRSGDGNAATTVANLMVRATESHMRTASDVPHNNIGSNERDKYSQVLRVAAGLLFRAAQNEYHHGAHYSFALLLKLYPSLVAPGFDQQFVAQVAAAHLCASANATISKLNQVQVAGRALAASVNEYCHQVELFSDIDLIKKEATMLKRMNIFDPITKKKEVVYIATLRPKNEKEKQKMPLLIQGLDAIIHDIPIENLYKTKKKCRVFSISGCYPALWRQFSTSSLPTVITEASGNERYVNAHRVGLVDGFSGSAYYHWLLEGLPRLLILAESEMQQTNSDDKLTIILPAGKHFIQDTIRLLPRRFLTAFSALHYRVPTLTIRAEKEILLPILDKKKITSRGSSATLCPSRAALLFIRNSFGLNESLTQVSKWRDGSPNLLILIARAPDEARALGNQEAVTAALASLAARRGLQFFLFQGHNTTMAHTIRTFNAARLVVGVHGAGLANTVFCSPYAAILELGLPEPEFIEYRHLAQQLHLHYAVSQLPPASFESRLWPRPNVIAQAAEALLDAAIPLPLSSSSSSSS